MVVEVTSKRFSGLVNPFDGSVMSVKMLVCDEGDPLFFAPETYTPCSALLSREESESKALRGGTGDLTCPYTGEALVQTHVDGLGWFFIGGFDPRVPRTADEFLHYATMRGGVSAAPSRRPIERAEYVEPRYPERPVDTPERTEEAHQIAKGVVEKFKDSVGMKNERTVVSLSVRRRRGK